MRAIAFEIAARTLPRSRLPLPPSSMVAPLDPASRYMSAQKAGEADWSDPQASYATMLLGRRELSSGSFGNAHISATIAPGIGAPRSSPDADRATTREQSGSLAA